MTTAPPPIPLPITLRPAYWWTCPICRATNWGRAPTVPTPVPDPHDPPGTAYLDAPADVTCLRCDSRLLVADVAAGPLP